MDIQEVAIPVLHGQAAQNDRNGTGVNGYDNPEIPKNSHDRAGDANLKTTTGIRSGAIPTDPDFASRIIKPIPDFPVADQTHYVWEISDWNTTRRSQKVQSPMFECGGCKWRITLFPRSNAEAVSLYLEPQSPAKLRQVELAAAAVKGTKTDVEPADADQKQEDSKWYVCAQFALDIWNPENASAHIPNTAHHRFTSREQDWGFSAFISPRELTARGIMLDNKVNISACVRVLDDSCTGVLWGDFAGYDSKTSTGFVGLNNQGATCYLNLLLQLYFVTGAFRALVYEIPTDSEDSSQNNHAESLVNGSIVDAIRDLNIIDGHAVTDVVAQLSNAKPSEENAKSSPDKAALKRARIVALAMQRAFAHMQLETSPVSTLEVTKSFGWDSSDAFTQHDVQELNRILMDKLELAMLGSPVQNRLNSLFVGAMKSYVKCVDVQYESSRVEPFWDIQLNVRGLQNLQESFKNYVEPELLSGDNKYDAGEEHGYQDAKKGVHFQWFPPVLHLQLKRFEYDFMVDDLVKIDDMYEYPDLIDLSSYLGDVPDSIRNQNWVYKLHGVLVHQGTVSNGHYYAMLKPFGETKEGETGWFRFDDDRVWKVTSTEVFHENFGARQLSPQVLRNLSRSEQQEYYLRRATSAYMLVYYREEALPTILPNTEIVVPSHVRAQIEAEKEATLARSRQRIEALHYLTVNLVAVDNFKKYSGFDIFPDPSLKKSLGRVDFDPDSYPDQIKVRKDAKIRDLLRLIANKYGYDSEADFSFSVYPLKPRANKTSRPESLISEDAMNETVMSFYLKHFKKRGEEMVLFVYQPEKDLMAGSKDKPASSANEEDVILFLKYYNADLNEITGLSYVSTKKYTMLSQILPLVNAALHLPAGSKLDLLEEVSNVRIEPLQADLTVEKNELVTGDIITVSLPGFTDAAHEKYTFLHTRVRVNISPSKITEENDFIVSSPVVADPLAPIEMWISSAWTYEELAKSIASQLHENVSSDHLRLYLVEQDLDGDSEDGESQIAKRYPLPSTVKLHQVFSKLHAAGTTHLEYEVLSVPLIEYESMRSINVHWLSTVLNPQLMRVFISKTSTVGDVISKVIEDLSLPKELWGGILAWTSVMFKYGDLMKFDMSIEEIPANADLCCGYFPIEVSILVDYNMYKPYTSNGTSAAVSKNLGPEFDFVHADEVKKCEQHEKSLNFIPVFHFQKLTTYVHSAPFILIVFPGEKWPETARRLSQKLGLDSKTAFDKMRVALADENDKGRYLELNSDMVLFDEIKRHDSSVSLALDHRERNPRRSYAQDKGISIG